MKFLSLILLTLMLGKGCDSQQEQDLADAVVEYSANTRGYYYKLTIQNKQVLISQDRDGKQKPEARTISDADWTALLAEFSKTDLEKLPTLKPPTDKRFYDGAAMADFKVNYKGKEYASPTFDHGNPPKEIEALITKITAFAPKRGE